LEEGGGAGGTTGGEIVKDESESDIVEMEKGV